MDYEELDSDLEFPPFQSSFSFNVAIIDNKIAEAASEGFTIILTNSQSDNLDIRIVEFARTTVAITEDDGMFRQTSGGTSLLKHTDSKIHIPLKTVQSLYVLDQSPKNECYYLANCIHHYSITIVNNRVVPIYYMLCRLTDKSFKICAKQCYNFFV